MGQFYFQINDSALLDPENDNSGNGLTNFQKYLLRLNPKAYDSLNLGMSDGEAVIQGIDPLTGARLSGDRKRVVDDYFDLEVISNRITLRTVQQPQIAEASGPVVGARNSGATTAGQSLPSGQIGTAASTKVSKVAGESSVAINTSIPGTLDIPSIKVTAPVVWTGDVRNIDKDLTGGVIHYPGTVLPGETGTSYISGHSSNYPWAKGSYNQIFSHFTKKIYFPLLIILQIYCNSY
jgi:hypothetical protein